MLWCCGTLCQAQPKRLADARTGKNLALKTTITRVYPPENLQTLSTEGRIDHEIYLHPNISTRISPRKSSQILTLFSSAS
jgi:hypothetical protein